MPHTAHTVSIDDVRVSALSEGHNPSSPQSQSYHINPLHLLQPLNSTRVGSYPNRHPTVGSSCFSSPPISLASTAPHTPLNIYAASARSIPRLVLTASNHPTPLQLRCAILNLRVRPASPRWLRRPRRRPPAPPPPVNRGGVMPGSLKAGRVPAGWRRTPTRQQRPPSHGLFLRLNRHRRPRLPSATTAHHGSPSPRASRLGAVDLLTRGSCFPQSTTATVTTVAPTSPPSVSSPARRP